MQWWQKQNLGGKEAFASETTDRGLVKRVMHEGKKGCIFLEGHLKAMCIISLFTKGHIVFTLLLPLQKVRNQMILFSPLFNLCDSVWNFFPLPCACDLTLSLRVIVHHSSIELFNHIHLRFVGKSLQARDVGWTFHRVWVVCWSDHQQWWL